MDSMLWYAKTVLHVSVGGFGRRERKQRGMFIIMGIIKKARSAEILLGP